MYFSNGWVLVFLLMLSAATAQTEIALASDIIEEIARCTGSSSCRACKNCNYCKYCNSGGSCGVCSGGSRTSNMKSSGYPRTNVYSSPTTHRKKTSGSYPTSFECSNTPMEFNNKNTVFYLSDDLSSVYYSKTLMVNTENLNLRTGPGMEYEIIEKLAKHRELVFLAMIGEWVKVRVKASSRIGFVHYKYIVVY